jgi:class 3 adenylate cyclase
MAPQVRYARAGDAHIAYETLGSGAVDIVFVPEFTTNLEEQWEEPRVAQVLERLASFSRLTLFDMRGIGLSDPVSLDHMPPFEEWMEDVRIVMDAAGVREAAVVAVGAGAAMSVLFAATHPDRVRALVLVNGYARIARADGYDFGLDPDLAAVAAEWSRRAWGKAANFALLAPSLADDDKARQSYARLQRSAASPGVVARMQEMLVALDVRAVLPAVRVPTLVLHRGGNQVFSVAHGRYLADHIPGARFVELPDADHLYWAGDTAGLLDEVEEFLTGVRSGPNLERVLTTVLFTDLVDSTATAARVGDERWRMLLDQHDAVVRQELERFRGRLINTTGDGVLASFDGPARAVRCACAIRSGLRRLGLRMRAGVHTGEVELRGNDLGGITVNIGARIEALAPPDEVYASRILVDLVVGSGIEFDRRATTTLKGVPGEWEVYAVTRA